jgi:DNA modification methylase
MNERANVITCCDCVDGMKALSDNSVDSIVTDPPAGIGFMGKEWDGDKGGRDEWIKWLSEVMKEGMRVLKPGGHAFVWALPRTSHWTATALENAGFEVRDCMYHVFGQGFPKSLDISKAIDRMKGAEREVTGIRISAFGDIKESETKDGRNLWAKPSTQKVELKNKPVTLESQEWAGWGTALKPAVECWWLCRKPLSEKTVAENVLKWGTGGININECRINIDRKENIDLNPRKSRNVGFTAEHGIYSGSKKYGLQGHKPMQSALNEGGRFPSHLIHDGSDEVLAEFEKAGESVGETGRAGRKSAGNYDASSYKVGVVTKTGMKDFGTPARFFYCAKASRTEREEGIENIEPRQRDTGHKKSNPGGDNPRNRGAHDRTNFHPTVKPIELMKYLIKLITPPGGAVLDMFAGSGSTLVAAKYSGFNFIGFEINEEYCIIARKRLSQSILMEATIESIGQLTKQND